MITCWNINIIAIILHFGSHLYSIQINYSSPHVGMFAIQRWDGSVFVKCHISSWAEEQMHKPLLTAAPRCTQNVQTAQTKTNFTWKANNSIFQGLLWPLFFWSLQMQTVLIATQHCLWIGCNYFKRSFFFFLQGSKKFISRV